MCYLPSSAFAAVPDAFAHILVCFDMLSCVCARRVFSSICSH